MKAYAMQGCHNYEDETVLAVYATRELALVALEARRPHQAFFEDRQVEAEEVEFGTDFDDRWMARCDDVVGYDYITVTEVDFVSC